MSILTEAATRWPEECALRYKQTIWTWRQLETAARLMACSLFQRGFSKGDTLAIHLAPEPETIALFWAGLEYGFVIAPLSLRLPAAGILQNLESVRAKAIISDTADPKLTDKPTELISPQNLNCPQGTELPDPVDNLPLNTLIFTSGSSAMSKAVGHSLANHIASARGSNLNIPLEPGSNWLLSLPLDHVSGLSLLFRTALSGASLSIPDSPDLATSILNLAPTHISLVASQLLQLMDHAEKPLQVVAPAAILVGGSHIPESLIQRAHKDGLALHTTYGSTELASQVTTTAPGADLTTLQSSGKLLLHRDLLISHEGEILLRGDTLSPGYMLEDSVQTLVDDDGWFHSGDLGYLDHRGLLHVTGRLDNQFISGGENIQPEEIEYCLERLPGLESAMVIPVSDEVYGQRPIAFLTFQDEMIDLADIRNHLEQDLPRFKHPQCFYYLPESLTRTSLKINRSDLLRFYKAQKNKLPPID